MNTTIITTAQTADLARAFADALVAQINRPSARNAKRLLRAEQAFRASRIDDLVASVQVYTAVAVAV